MAKKYAIIGLGNFGFYVAKALFEEGHDVIAVDINQEAIQKIQPYCSQAILGDATQKDMIKTLGLEIIESQITGKGTIQLWVVNTDKKQ